MIKRLAKVILPKRFSSRIWLWLRILRRLQGTTITFELGLLVSAILDTITFTLRPDLAASPRSYFSGVVRSKKFDCCWHIRKMTDDIYCIMPEREGDVDEMIRSRLKHGDTFIDVGANIGYYTVIAARLVGSGGRVVAVEPMPETREILKANCNLNHLGNVDILSMALWSDEREMPIHVSNGAYGMASLTRSCGESVLIKTIPLDSISESFSNIKMIKIDAEGAEYQILCGSEATLKKTNSVILECLSDYDDIRDLLSPEFKIRELSFTSYILADKLGVEAKI